MNVVLEYYTDESLQRRVPVNEAGQPLFDWGEITAGQKKEKTYYIKNMTADTVTLRQPYTNDEDFKIKTFPTQLKAHQTGILKLEFFPAWNRSRPLDTSFGFDKIIG